MTKMELTHNDLMEPHPKGAPLSFRLYHFFRKVWHKTLPRKMFRRVCRGGIYYVANRDELFSRKILQIGNWESDKVLHLFNAARRGVADIFLDIGANFGYYALTATKTGDFAEIHALEPQPETYRSLLRQLEANNFPRLIIPHNIAASDKDGEVFIDAASRAGAFVSPEKRVLTVPIKSAMLDSLFNFRDRRIAAKIDVEGHEVAVLNGMRNLLAHNAVFLQVEIWERHSESIHQFINAGLRCVHRAGDDFYFANDKWAENNG